MFATRYLASLTILTLAACPDDSVDVSTSLGSSTSFGTLGGSTTSGAGATTTEESATLIMGSTSAPDPTTGGDDIHHGPGACGNIGPADCTPGDNGWCSDVVTLCDFLAPVNTNRGFCLDMGEICEAQHVTPCTICTILQRQCEIERDTTVDCTDYTATCGCLLDAGN